ncbi:hypothetical protein BN1708_008563 [Verticillium longisporum]|uniref:Apple domain-containing protein n=1 Tax=Verticillium longisporum TaxID=100787 RepID=A0A0G4N5Z7_VERLO|nr:hypothetical protein BN1708_008563 [Verticillium longisporum]
MRFAVLLGATTALLAEAGGALQSAKHDKGQRLDSLDHDGHQGRVGRWAAALRSRHLQGQAAHSYNGTNSTTLVTEPTYVVPPPGPAYNVPSVPEEDPSVTDCPGHVLVSTTTLEVTTYITEGGSEYANTNTQGYENNASQTKVENKTQYPYPEHTAPTVPSYLPHNVSTTTTTSLKYDYAPYPGNTTTATFPSNNTTYVPTATEKTGFGHASDYPYPANNTRPSSTYHLVNISTTTQDREYETGGIYTEPTTLVSPPYPAANISTTRQSTYEYGTGAPHSYPETTGRPITFYHSANVSTTQSYSSKTSTSRTPDEYASNEYAPQEYAAKEYAANEYAPNKYTEHDPRPPVSTLNVHPSSSSSARIYSNYSSTVSTTDSSGVVTTSESAMTSMSSGIVLTSETEVTASPYETLTAYGAGYIVAGYEDTYEDATTSESQRFPESSKATSEPETLKPSSAHNFPYGQSTEVVTLSESTVRLESSGHVYLSETQSTVSPSDQAYASQSSASISSESHGVSGSSTQPYSATDYLSTYAVTEPLPSSTSGCVIDTSIAPISVASLTSQPAVVETPTKTVSEGSVPTGKPETGSLHCGVHGKPVGNYFLARFVENSPGVPVTLEGCYQFCDSVMDATDGCESYRFYPERDLNVARCDLYGSSVAYALDSVDDYYPDIWFDIECGSPRSSRWAHLPGIERLESLGLE